MAARVNKSIHTQAERCPEQHPQNDDCDVGFHRQPSVDNNPLNQKTTSLVDTNPSTSVPGGGLSPPVNFAPPSQPRGSCRPGPWRRQIPRVGPRRSGSPPLPAAGPLGASGRPTCTRRRSWYPWTEPLPPPA